MSVPELKLLPQVTGFAIADAEEVLAVQLEGGAARYRRVQTGAATIAQVQFALSQDEYEYFNAFYATTIQNGALPFSVNMAMDGAGLALHEVRIVPGSLQRAAAGRVRWTVGASLEVVPPARDAEFDQGLVDLVDAYGDVAVAVAVLEALDQLANTDLPGALG